MLSSPHCCRPPTLLQLSHASESFVQGQVLLGWSSSVACFHLCLQDQASLDPLNTKAIQTNQKPTKKKNFNALTFPSLQWNSMWWTYVHSFFVFYFQAVSGKDWTLGTWISCTHSSPIQGEFFRGRHGIHQNMLSPYGRLGQKHLLVYLKSFAGHFSESWQTGLYIL